jgi:ribulose kinase
LIRAESANSKPIVAGVDFGTLSVCVSIVDGERDTLATALAEYPLHRKRKDSEYATQSHDDQMRALEGGIKSNWKSDSVNLPGCFYCGRRVNVCSQASILQVG